MDSEPDEPASEPSVAEYEAAAERVLGHALGKADPAAVFPSGSGTPWLLPCRGNGGANDPACNCRDRATRCLAEYLAAVRPRLRELRRRAAAALHRAVEGERQARSERKRLVLSLIADARRDGDEAEAARLERKHASLTVRVNGNAVDGMIVPDAPEPYRALGGSELDPEIVVRRELLNLLLQTGMTLKEAEKPIEAEGFALGPNDLANDAQAISRAAAEYKRTLGLPYDLFAHLAPRYGQTRLKKAAASKRAIRVRRK